MNYSLLTNQITGNWLVQNTKYSLLKTSQPANTFISQINWTHLNFNDKDNFSNLVNNNLYNSLIPLSAYCSKLQENSFSSNNYNILLIDKNSKNKWIFKYDNKLNLINKFMIKYHSENYLLMVADGKKITITEKIYFLHNNLKVTKSIVKKYGKCIGISFSSEIRIS